MEVQQEIQQIQCNVDTCNVVSDDLKDAKAHRRVHFNYKLACPYESCHYVFVYEATYKQHYGSCHLPKVQRGDKKKKIPHPEKNIKAILRLGFTTVRDIDEKKNVLVNNRVNLNELGTVGEASHVQSMIFLKKLSLDPISVDYGVQSNAKMDSESLKPSLFSVPKGSRNFSHLFDLHGDHDIDSLLSQVVGDTILKLNLENSSVAEKIKNATLQTDALKAVSTYRQKFGQTLLSNRLPGPIALLEVSSSFTTGSVGIVCPSIAVQSAGPAATLHVGSSSGETPGVSKTVGQLNSYLCPVLRAPAKNGDPRLWFAQQEVVPLDVNHPICHCPNSTNLSLPKQYQSHTFESPGSTMHVGSSSGETPGVSKTVGQLNSYLRPVSRAPAKNGDTRLWFAQQEVVPLDVNQPIGGKVNSRKHNIPESPFHDRTFKRLRNGFTDIEVSSDAHMVPHGWSEDRCTFDSLPLDRIHQKEQNGTGLGKQKKGETSSTYIQYPSTGIFNVRIGGNKQVTEFNTSTTTNTVYVPSLMKEVVVNTTNSLQNSGDPAQIATLPPTNSSMIHGTGPLINVASSKSLDIEQNPTERSPVTALVNSTKESYG